MPYQEEYNKSINEPEKFWNQKALELEWFKNPKNTLSKDDKGLYHWFADGEMNTAYMALDYHVNQGRGEQAALIYDSPVSGVKQKYTYSQLLDEVAKTAGMIKNAGVIKGDRVIIYMPMIPQVVIAMLACARLGAVHCVVFGGFAAPELSVRINDAMPKLILSASCGIEVKKIIEYKPLLDKAIELATHKVEKCIIYQRKQKKAVLISGRDFAWQTLLIQAKPAQAVAVKGDDLLYVLYTSGTTGKPKGVTRESGGHSVAMKYSMSAIYDTQPGDVFFAASDVGWIVGHSYIVYAPLLQGCTTILYEGKPVMTPDAGAFWRIVEEYKVKALFTAPTAYRAIKKADPKGEFVKKYDISSLKMLFAAGEILDPATHNWLHNTLGVPVIDNWWQTETGWAIASNITGIEKMPTKLGSATMPTPGFQIKILDETGKELKTGKQGNIAIKLPMPPSCLTSIWGDENRFSQAYLQEVAGFYISGDGGYFDKDGYLFVTGRVDDVINVAGHRLSTGEIEGVIASHNKVAECAVVGGFDELKGQIPIGFIVLKDEALGAEDEIKQELTTLVRSEIGAIVCYKKSIIVKKLPKTRSGKIVRKTIAAILDNKAYTIPATIDDPLSLDEIKQALIEQK